SVDNFSHQARCVNAFQDLLTKLGDCGLLSGMSGECLFLKFLLGDIAPDAQHANHLTSFIPNNLRTVADLRETSPLTDHSGFEPNDAVAFNLLTVNTQCLAVIVRMNELSQWSKRLPSINQFFNLAPFGIQVHLIAVGIDPINHVIHGVEDLSIFS